MRDKNQKTPVLPHQGMFLFAALIIAGALILAGAACGDSQPSGTTTSGIEAVTGSKEDSDTGANAVCYESDDDARLTGYELISGVQAQIPYKILVPTYLPDGFKLDPGSIMTTQGYDLDNPEELRVGYATNAYEFIFKQGNLSLGMGCNIVGEMYYGWEAQTRVVRGHLCLVYYNAKIDEESGNPNIIPFEQSKSYLVFWKEGEDFTNPDLRAGSYVLQTEGVGWDETARVAENLALLNQTDACLPMADRPLSAR